MRIINCRFDSLKNMEKLLSKFGIEGEVDNIVEINYDTKEVKRRKTKKIIKCNFFVTFLNNRKVFTCLACSLC